MRELNDQEFMAFAKQYKTPQHNIDTIKKYFVLMGDAGGGTEHFECRYCGRCFAIGEVFLSVDPRILTEHPIRGYDYIRAPIDNPAKAYWKHQCAVTDPLTKSENSNARNT